MTPIPAQVEYWIKQMVDPKNNDFQKDLYRMKLEDLQRHISAALASSPASKVAIINKR